MNPEQRFLIHRFAHEAVVYDCLSGDTHYLNELAYARLQGLPACDIAARWGLADDQSLQDSLAAIDEQLRAWELLV